ncbi:MAG: efflux RND transporter periplasmic adaptor subunit [Pirellula sp.]
MLGNSSLLAARLATLLCLYVGSVSYGLIQAHEGHKPLPTKGVEVDATSGTLVLSASARDAIDVKTEEVLQGPLASHLNAFGILDVPWNNHALVGPLMEGRVESVHVVAGDQVQAGQVIAQIASPLIEQMQKEIRDLVAGVDLDQQLLQGAQEASKNGAIPAARILELQTSLFQNQTALKIAKTKWLGLGLDLSSLERILAKPTVYQSVRLGLIAPISGTVLHNDLTVGKVVNPKEHVLEIIDLSTLWLRIEVLEQDVSKVSQGDPVEFFPTSAPGGSITGTIRVIEKVLDPRTHVATAWVDLQNDHSNTDELLPGMTGRVRIGKTSASPKLQVPNTAVIRDGAERFVLVEQERTAKASLFRKIPVAIGVLGNRYAEVTRGELVPGDRVLTQGSRQLGHLFSQGVLRLSTEAMQDIGLKTAVTQIGSVSRIVFIDGIVSLPPSKLARVSPQLSGRIHQVLVDRGASVRNGEPLALVSSIEFQDLQLRAIQANLGLRFRESVLENIRQAGSSVPSRQKLEAQNQLVEAKNQYDNAIHQLKLLGIQDQQIESIIQSQQVMQYYPVIAPIDGVIVGFNKAIGHTVSADEELFELHEPSARLVEAYISEKDARTIRPGQALRCQSVALEGRSFPGTILSSGKSLSNRGQTLSVWAQVNFEPEAVVFHNMLCRLAIEVPESATDADRPANLHESNPLVPLSSILQEGSQSYLFVALTDGTFERRRVTLGPRDDRQVTVVMGLSPQETVVIEGVAALQTGYAAVQ